MTDAYREFLQFHADNPQVYERIVELSRKLYQRGCRRYSMRGLFYVLRYEAELQTGGILVWIGGERQKLKLKNGHSPYYARLLRRDHPALGAMFSFCESAADDAFVEGPIGEQQELF